MAKITRDEARHLLKQMMQIRQFEDAIMDLMARNIAEGGSHLYAGEEACAVGAMAAIREDDYITSTHRGHGHAIAKGGSLPELMAEILGKETGVCKGKGGSLHLADVSKGNLGANGIVGGSIGIAAGAGLSIQLRGTDQVVLCFFGDGATNTGLFHESLNMAGKWKLPVVFICENNLYGMSVSVERACAVNDLTKKAVPYNMPAECCDGMDVLAVKDAVAKYAAAARKGGGPALIVCNTYRYYGHSRSDPRAYRTREEEKLWRGRDCIKAFGQKIQEQKILTEKEVADLEKEVTAELEAAVDFAIKSPDPKPEELYKDVYCESPSP
ncbi:MAG: thiamine pyrophosphate-dependent enzyme [Candidatus Omnitrophota bacterium]